MKKTNGFTMPHQISIIDLDIKDAVQVFGGHHRLRLALRYNFALFHQIEVVAELCCKAQIMQSSQNRNVQFLDD